MTASPSGSTPVPRARLRLFYGALIVVAVSYGAAFFLSPSNAKMGFYNAAAALIPLVVVTLAVDGRLFALSLPWHDGTENIVGSSLLRVVGVVIRAAPLVALGVAERLTLHPLATGDPRDGNPRFIYAAAVAAYVAFGLLAIFGPVGGRDKSRTSCGN